MYGLSSILVSELLGWFCIKNSDTEMTINFFYGRREGMFYLTTHSTHFIYGYMASDKDHSDSERRNTLPPHMLLFLISSKGSFICIIPQTV